MNTFIIRVSCDTCVNKPCGIKYVEIKPGKEPFRNFLENCAKFVETGAGRYENFGHSTSK